MAKLQHFTPRVTAEAVMTLDQEELRALEALVCYGIEPLLALFYKHMGSVYLKPHEAGLRSFLKTAHQASEGVRAVDQAQSDLNEYRIEKGRRKAQAATLATPPKEA
jgi:hypothetical protein